MVLKDLGQVMVLPVKVTQVHQSKNMLRLIGGSTLCVYFFFFVLPVTAGMDPSDPQWPQVRISVRWWMDVVHHLNLPTCRLDHGALMAALCLLRTLIQTWRPSITTVFKRPLVQMRTVCNALSLLCKRGWESLDVSTKKPSLHRPVLV